MTDEQRARLFDKLRRLAEQVGNAEACGLADPSDDDARMAAIITTLDEEGRLEA